jgi:hypothetical protein
MAKKATGKTVKQLKQERTLAKSAFTKHANFLSRAAGNMTSRVNYKRSSKSSRLMRGVSVRAMTTTIPACWQILKLKKRAKKQS